MLMGSCSASGISQILEDISLSYVSTDKWYTSYSLHFLKMKFYSKNEVITKSFKLEWLFMYRVNSSIVEWIFLFIKLRHEFEIFYITIIYKNNARSLINKSHIDHRVDIMFCRTLYVKNNDNISKNKMLIRIYVYWV